MEEEDDIFGNEFIPNNDEVTEIQDVSSVILDDNEDVIFENTKSPIVEKLLETRGIVDSKIKIIDENEEEVEVDFNELPLEEQLEILTTNDEPVVETGLEGVNAQFFDKLKENNIDVNQYLTAYKESILKEVEQPEVEETFDIDGYSDQELFLLDLKAKYDLNDEELELELNKALENEELFNKKVSKTRDEYKQLEVQHKEAKEQEIELKKQTEHKEFSDNMIKVAIANSEYHGIEIEDSEKNAVLGDILETGEDGLSSFDRDLKNPEKQFEAAWFMRYGKEAFEAIQNAYEGEIERLKKDIPKQGKKKAVVVKPPKKDSEEN